MSFTKVETSVNLSKEFTDKAVTGKKSLAKFARKKPHATPKNKPARPRKS